MTLSSGSFPVTSRLVPRFYDLGRTGSTNAVLRQLPDLQSLTTVVSQNQTAGRGRRGRSWVAAPNEALAVSFVLPLPSDHRYAASWVPLGVGLSVVRAMREMGVDEVGLKWPNDVLVRGAKLSGVLCEELPSGKIIAGVGVNLKFEGTRPAPGATALADHTPWHIGIADLVVAAILGQVRRSFALEQEVLARAVRSETMTLGRLVKVLEPGRPCWHGRARSIDSDGLLVVVNASGHERCLAVADVEHLYQ